MGRPARRHHDPGTGPAASQAATPIRQAVLGEPEAQTPEISTDELSRVLGDGSATVFDARPRREYAISHIPGTRNVAPKPDVPASAYVSDVAEIGRLLHADRSAPSCSTATGGTAARANAWRRSS